MGFLSKMFNAGVKTVLIPIAIVKDVTNVATGDDVDATSDLVDKLVDDIKDAGDGIGDGDLL